MQRMGKVIASRVHEDSMELKRRSEEIVRLLMKGNQSNSGLHIAAAQIKKAWESYKYPIDQKSTGEFAGPCDALENG